MLANFLNFVWMLTSVFLILVILIQRGRGGGLAGAFGAVGGSSAFGTRAGDTMTKITVGVFLFWLLQAAILVKLMGSSNLAGEIGKLGGGTEAKKVLDGDQNPPIVPNEGPSKNPVESTGEPKTGDAKAAEGKTATEKSDKPIMPAPPPATTTQPKPAENAKDAKSTPAKDGNAAPAKDAKAK